MQVFRFQPTSKRLLAMLFLGTVTMGLASCAHLAENAPRDPFLTKTSPAEAKTASEPKADSDPNLGSAKSIAGIPLPINAEEGPVVANHTKVRQVQQTVETQSVNGPEMMDPPAAQDAICPPEASAEWCPPPAMGLPGECPSCYPGGMNPCPPIVPAWIGGAAIAPKPKHYPDEYLCDGGDRGYPIRYDFNVRLGVETEDTFAEYTDHTGDNHVKPTNKVCVYAPRFGAVRSISSPILGTTVDHLASADKFQGGAGMRNRDATGLHNQNVALGNYRMRERASDIDVDLRSSAVDQAQRLAGHTKLMNTFEDFQFVQTGLLTQTDEVRLAQSVQAAAIWSRNQFPVIAARTDQAQEVASEFHAQEIVGREDKRKPGRLRIVKLADKTTAQPGDTITFTIRYDNLGERELSNIRIIDNLTPRLQYVEDSETSDRAGELLLEDNQEGSLILEFVLDEPLPGGQGGVVTFQTTVR